MLTRILVATALLSTTAASAGPHLGMKKACQRYGEAWLSGSRDALMGAVTPDFAAAWSRVPEKEFAEIPRVRHAASVISSGKSGGAGSVSLETSDGVVTFFLVGRGFNWRVADVHKPGVDGKPLSVTQSIHATSTVREFIHSFAGNGDEEAIKSRMSSSFWTAFASLDGPSRTRVREWLKPQGAKSPPAILIEGDRAAVTVAPMNGEDNDRVVFQLTRERGEWKVDDMAFETKRHFIASWRDQLPVIGAVASFRAFIRKPASVAPAQFASGELADELVRIHQKEVDLPSANAGKFVRFETTTDNHGAIIRFENATLVARTTPAAPGKIESVTLIKDGKEQNLTAMLSARRAIEKIPGAEVVARVLGLFNGENAE